MFGSRFSQRLTSRAPVVAPRVDVRFDPLGYTFTLPGVQAQEWMNGPQLLAEPPETGAQLAMLWAEGHVQVEGDSVRLTWAALYTLKRDPQFAGFLDDLGIHSECSLRPRLTSRSALMDAEFAVVLDGWAHPDGRPAKPVPKLVGRIVLQGTLGGTDTLPALLPEGVHVLLEEVQRFHAVPMAERTQSFKEQAFGRMRRLALAAGCPVSDYVARTVVVTPERLSLSMRAHGLGQGKVVEIVPGFEEEPPGWLAQFDRLPLRESYDVPDGPALTRVIVSPQVRTVLAEIKRMPGRRAAGARAQAFVRNPLALLGDDAAEVINGDDCAGLRAQSARLAGR